MPTVGKWRKRVIECGLAGLYDEHRITGDERASRLIGVGRRDQGGVMETKVAIVEVAQLCGPDAKDNFYDQAFFVLR